MSESFVYALDPISLSIQICWDCCRKTQMNFWANPVSFQTTTNLIMWCTWLKTLWSMDRSCWPCMVDPIWLLVPLASPPMMHGLLLLTEHAMALQLLRLFMSCFLSLECPYPPCPQHKHLLVLHGPNISSSDAFPTLLHNELLPPALCTWPAWFLPPWVALVYPPDWKSLKTETSPLVAWYPQNLSHGIPTVSPYKQHRKPGGRKEGVWLKLVTVARKLCLIGPQFPAPAQC